MRKGTWKINLTDLEIVYPLVPWAASSGVSRKPASTAMNIRACGSSLRSSLSFTGAHFHDFAASLQVSRVPCVRLTVLCVYQSDGL